MLLDISGNIVRFAEDFEALFHDGLASLDMGEKLDKTVRKDRDDDHEPTGCPKCQFKPFGKRCMSCGFEIVKRNLLEHEAGTMVEFTVGKVTVGDKSSVWAQCVTLMRSTGAPATAAQRAAHLYKSITGAFPRSLPDFDAVADVTVTRGVMNKYKANKFAYRRAA